MPSRSPVRGSRSPSRGRSPARRLTFPEDANEPHREPVTDASGRPRGPRGQSQTRGTNAVEHPVLPASTRQEAFLRHRKILSDVPAWDKGKAVTVLSFITTITTIFDTADTPYSVRPQITDSKLEGEALQAHQETYCDPEVTTPGALPAWPEYCAWLRTWGSPSQADAATLDKNLQSWRQRRSDSVAQWVNAYRREAHKIKGFPDLKKKLTTPFLIGHLIDGLHHEDPIYEKVYDQHQAQPFTTITAAADYILLKDKSTSNHPSRKALYSKKGTPGQDRRNQGRKPDPRDLTFQEQHKNATTQALYALLQSNPQLLNALQLPGNTAGANLGRSGPQPSQQELQIMGTSAVRSGQRVPPLTDEARALCARYKACTRCREPYSSCQAATCTKFANRNNFNLLQQLQQLQNTAPTAQEPQESEQLNEEPSDY